MYATIPGEFESPAGYFATVAMTEEYLQLHVGFRFELPGDGNATGGVEVFDHSSADACLAGPGSELDPTACPCFDLDSDGDHVHFDIARLQGHFTGG